MNINPVHAGVVSTYPRNKSSVNSKLNDFCSLLTHVLININ